MIAILLAFLKKIPAKGYAMAGAVALLLIAYGALVAHEREVGRLQVQLHAADSTANVAQRDAAHWQAVARRDSATADSLAVVAQSAKSTADSALAREHALQRPLAATRATLDSLLALQNDTASAGLVGAVKAALAASDASLNACHDSEASLQGALHACEAHGAALALVVADQDSVIAGQGRQIQAQAVQVRALKGNQPGFLRVWVVPLATLGLGYLIGHWR